MRILFVSNGSNWGGACVALLNLIHGLKLYGHDIAVFVPEKKGRFVDELHHCNVKCFVASHKYGNTIIPKTSNKIKYIKQYIEKYIRLILARYDFNKVINVYKPDLVHTNVGPLDIAFTICQKKGIPHVWHMREYQDLDFNMTFMPSKKSFIKKIHSAGNYNIAITKGIFDHWHLREIEDQVIYDPVISSTDMTNVELEKENIMLIVGRIEPAKGQLNLLYAWKEFVKMNPEYRLLIVGSEKADVKYTRQCVLYVKQNNLEDNVSFLGERNDVYQLMRKAKALIVASRNEGFGFITSEAMYNNCIVIGYNTAGTKEQFDNGLVDSGSEIALRFLNQSELLYNLDFVKKNDCSLMIKNARNVVAGKYTIEKSAYNVDLFYKKILNRNE